MNPSVLSICAVIPLVVGSSAFVVLPSAGFSSRYMIGITSHSCSSSCGTAVSMSQDGAGLDRRRFLSSVTFAATVAGATGLMAVDTGSGSVAQAAVGDSGGQLGDLESGPPEPMDVKKGEPLSPEAARIQQKLAAQEKATGRSSSGALTFSESMAAEGKKQAKMKAEKNDMAKRRAAMCEELGRGC